MVPLTIRALFDNNTCNRLPVIHDLIQLSNSYLRPIITYRVTYKQPCYYYYCFLFKKLLIIIEFIAPRDGITADLFQGVDDNFVMV